MNEPNAAALFPIVENGKFGYINDSGAVVIAPEFAVAKRFSEGLARVKAANNKWGFINETGDLAIEPRFEIHQFGGDDNLRSLDFREGRAAVSLDGGRKWGHINRRGEQIVPAIYDSASEFSEGVAVVGKRAVKTEGKRTFHASDLFYIDRNGKILDFPHVGDLFSEELAAVRPNRKFFSPEREKEGYINKNGEFAIEPQEFFCRRFAEGLAPVRVLDRLKWGFIDKTGRLAINTQFTHADNFHEGLARVGDGLITAFVDKTGNLAFRRAFAAAGNFSEGLAAAHAREQTKKSPTGVFAGRGGYIDKTGEWAIEPRFNFILGDFRGGLAIVIEVEEPGFSFGYINKSGQYVWRERFAESYPPGNNSVMTGCSMMSDLDGYYADYPCALNIKIF